MTIDPAIQHQLFGIFKQFERSLSSSSVTQNAVQSHREFEDVKAFQKEHGIDLHPFSEVLLTVLGPPSYQDNDFLKNQLEFRANVALELIDMGMDINVKRPHHDTPLILAVRHHSFSLIKTLIDRGAHVNGPGLFNFTPLHLSAKHSDPQVARYLIEKGAYVNAQPAPRLSTPLHEAVTLQNAGMVSLLLEHQANVHLENINGFTPLNSFLKQMPARDAAYDICELLLKAGSQIKFKQEQAHLFNGLQMAIKNQCPQTFELLLQSGHPVSQSFEGFSGEFSLETPLHTAVRLLGTDFIKMLLQFKADPHAPDSSGRSALDVARTVPLMLAAQQEVLDILMAHQEKVLLDEATASLTQPDSPRSSSDHPVHSLRL